jgi:hypothetical protein
MIVIVVEGVLMKPVASTLIPLGAMVYNAFRGVSQVLLVSNETPVDILENWLWMEGLSGWAEIFPPDEIMRRGPAPDYRLWQANQIRKKGYSVELIVEADPAVCALLLASGYSVLNYLHALYSLPAWRPDYEYKVKPWDELSQQVATLAAMRAADKRTKEDK